MDSLPEDATGRWRMRTETGSVYELDLDASTARRVPDLANDYGATLRRDGEVLPLVDRPQVRVGAPAALPLAGLRHGAFTLRLTSVVVELVPVD